MSRTWSAHKKAVVGAKGKRLTYRQPGTAAGLNDGLDAQSKLLSECAVRVRILVDSRPRSSHCIYCGATSGLEEEHIIPFVSYGADLSSATLAAAVAQRRSMSLKHRYCINTLTAFRARTKIPLRKRRRRTYKYKVIHASVDGKPPPAPPLRNRR